MNKKIFNFINIFVVLTMSLFSSSAFGKYEKIFYDFSITSIDGNPLDLKHFTGKTILLVNVASYCGFTKQYDDMQKLWNMYKEKGLIILGVPSNSFNQEKNTENEVKKFCEVNFNITFPMTSIFEVKGENAHKIYEWAKNNHGNSAVPKWNFHKILINKEGKVEDTFASFTNPTSKKIINKIEKILN